MSSVEGGGWNLRHQGARAMKIPYIDDRISFLGLALGVGLAYFVFAFSYGWWLPLLLAAFVGLIFFLGNFLVINPPKSVSAATANTVRFVAILMTIVYVLVAIPFIISVIVFSLFQVGAFLVAPIGFKDLTPHPITDLASLVINLLIFPLIACGLLSFFLRKTF